VSQIDLELFRRVKRVAGIEGQLRLIGSRYEHQIKVCQFIHFLMNNFRKCEQVNGYLLAMMSKHLGQLVEVFGWQDHPYMAQLKRSYCLPGGEF
jgi:hypothetical protein